MEIDGACRRLVVKVGTSTLVDRAGRLDRSYMLDLSSQLALQRGSGRDVVLVTSGAIRAGREVLDARPFSQAEAPVEGEAAAPADSGSDSLTSLRFKQAAAAIGQSRLMHIYSEAFAWRGIDCAQVLLTRDDIEDERRFVNARNTLLTLLEMGVIPIINENDTVAVDEIRFGDNDNLAAFVARLISADLLIILSDVEGLYGNGAPGDRAAPIQTVDEIDDTVLALAGEPGEYGTGGMRTKIEAARLATEAGIRAVIAQGRQPDVVARVVDGAPIGTSFLPRLA